MSLLIRLCNSYFDVNLLKTGLILCVDLTNLDLTALSTIVFLVIYVFGNEILVYICVNTSKLFNLIQ